MSFLDSIIGILLAYAVFKGMRNGLFAEVASFLSLILGIYIAIHFSSLIKVIFEKFVKWNPYTIQIIAFILTFIIVVLGVSYIGKVFTKIANFAYLGWLNKIGGGFFRALKTLLILSVIFSIFEKINYNHFLVKKETLAQSIFYHPIQKTTNSIFPSIEQLYKKTTFIS